MRSTKSRNFCHELVTPVDPRSIGVNNVRASARIRESLNDLFIQGQLNTLSYPVFHRMLVLLVEQ